MPKSSTQPEEVLDEGLSLDADGKETLTSLLTHTTRKGAAQALNISPQALWLRMNKYGLHKYMDEIPERALKTLRMGSDRAAEVFVEALEERGNKMEAAKEILDRVGVGKNQPNTQVNIAGGEMSVEFVSGGNE